MDDAELVKQLRLPWFTNGCEMLQRKAADRIEALIAERDAARDAALEEAATECDRLRASYARSAQAYADDDPEKRKIKWSGAVAAMAAENIRALKGKTE